MLIEYVLNHDGKVRRLQLSEQNTLELLSLYKDFRTLQFAKDLGVKHNCNYYEAILDRLASALLPNNLITKQLKIYQKLFKAKFRYYNQSNPDLTLDTLQNNPKVLYNVGFLSMMKFLKSLFVDNIINLHVWNVESPKNMSEYEDSLDLINYCTMARELDPHDDIQVIDSYGHHEGEINPYFWKACVVSSYNGSHVPLGKENKNNFDEFDKITYRFCKNMQKQTKAKLRK